MAGNAGRAGVEVQIGIAIEPARLRIPALIDQVAAAQCEIAAAGAM